MNEDVILVNIIKDVVDSMSVEGIDKVYYQPGRNSDIIKSLNDLDNSITMKGLKYPLIAMVLPIREKRGSGFYASIVIPRIVIATLSSAENTERILEKYEEFGSFKKILYPCYYEFLKRLAWSRFTIVNDPDYIVHTKMDSPGQQPIGQGLSDYVDIIEILNLEINLNQPKNC